jgi:dienelactone hydrolase
MIGWSNGGSTVLAATNVRHPEVRHASHRPSLAVAFYPGCQVALEAGYEAVAPLLLLTGALDDWTPSAPCEALAASAGSAMVQLAVYPNAYHGFDGTTAVRLRTDVPNGTRPGQGVHVGGHAPSREAAHERLDAFLKAHWRLP